MEFFQSLCNGGVGGQSVLNGSWGIVEIASEIKDSLFKSSAQRARMSLLSVSRTYLSEERTGIEPAVFGP